LPACLCTCAQEHPLVVYAVSRKKGRPCQWCLEEHHLLAGSLEQAKDWVAIMRASLAMCHDRCVCVCVCWVCVGCGCWYVCVCVSVRLCVCTHVCVALRSVASGNVFVYGQMQSKHMNLISPRRIFLMLFFWNKIRYSLQTSSHTRTLP